MHAFWGIIITEVSSYFNIGNAITSRILLLISLDLIEMFESFSYSIVSWSEDLKNRAFSVQLKDL